MENKKKKPSFFLVLFRLILILLLLVLLAAAGFAWWFCDQMKKTDVVIDDIPAFLSAEPMDPGERFAVRDRDTLVTTLDKNDIWWMIDRLYGMGWLSDAASAAGEHGVELEGVGLRLEDGSAALEARAHWKSIVLTASAPLDIRCEGGEIRVVPAGLMLGGVPVPETLLEKYLPADLSELTLSYRPETFFSDKVTSAVFAGDKLLLTEALSPEIFSSLPDLPRMQYYRYRLFMDGYGPALEAFTAWQKDPASAYDDTISRLEDNGLAFADLAFSVCLLMDEKDLDDLALKDLNHGFTARWMPDVGAIASVREAREGSYSLGSKSLTAFQDALEDAYCAGKLTVLDGQYRYEGEPFTPEAFFGEAWEEYRGLFGSEDVTLCVVALPGYTDPHAPALGSISDGTDSFDGEPDMDRRAPLGVLVQGQDGSGYLLLRSVAKTMAGPLGGWG